MKKANLTGAQLSDLWAQIYELDSKLEYNNDGELATLSGIVEFESDGLAFKLTSYIESRGYREDDYFSGTGAWVETYRDAWIDINIVDEYGNDYAIDKEIEKEIENYLNSIQVYV